MTHVKFEEKEKLTLVEVKGRKNDSHKSENDTCEWKMCAKMAVEKTHWNGDTISTMSERGYQTMLWIDRRHGFHSALSFSSVQALSTRVAQCLGATQCLPLRIVQSLFPEPIEALCLKTTQCLSAEVNNDY